jgi:hypothetical protein
VLLHSSKITHHNYFKNLTESILWVSDTINPDALKKFCEVNGHPKFIVGDNAFSIRSNYFEKIYTTVVRGLELQFMKFQHLKFVDTAPTTEYCFNFIVNKKQINRYLLIKLVEYFQFQNFNYTWSGIGKEFDLSEIIQQWNRLDPNQTTYTSDLRNCILHPVEIDEHFFHSSESKASIITLDYDNNLSTWNNWLGNLFSSSAVSLISESVAYQHSSVFTEKTLYSILGLTFPLFVGGYGHANDLEKIGFDIFSDVIDHSYQYRATLWERCYYAIYLNRQILSDLLLATHLRNQHHERLINNRRMLYNGHLTNHIQKTIQAWPDELAIPALAICDQLRQAEFTLNQTIVPT